MIMRDSITIRVRRLPRKAKKDLKKAFGPKAYKAWMRPYMKMEFNIGINVEDELVMLLNEQLKETLCHSLKLPKKYLS
mgnify:CR=1 FL=1